MIKTGQKHLERLSPLLTGWSVICIGAVAPAAWTYSRLQRLLDGEAHLIVKDLEGYAKPLATDYGLHSEIEAITHMADAAEFQCFDLVGYSAGGGVALAFALANPDRVSSLTLIEPAWIGNHIRDSREASYLTTVDEAMQLPVSQRGQGLLMAMSPPGTDPATLPTPDWLTDRADRFEPIWRSFREAALDIEALRSFTAPVYLPVGGRSHPRFTLAAHWLASLFPYSWVDIYEDQTHLEVPPIRETERFICALRKNREGVIADTL